MHTILSLLNALLPIEIIVAIVLFFVILKVCYDRKERQAFRQKIDALYRSVADGTAPIDDEPQKWFVEPQPGDLPTLPLIIIGSNGYVDLENSIKTGGVGNLLGALCCDDHEIGLYAADGTLWRSQLIYPPIRLRPLMSFLANTVYNPPMPYREMWHRERTYTSYELIELLCLYVEADDDILTQHMEAKRLIKLIRKAKHFMHLFNTLRRVFDGPTEPASRKPGENTREASPGNSV